MNIKPYQTAIARKSPSAPVKEIFKGLKYTPNILFLDYGCGRGMDWKFFSSLGATGIPYDKHEPFGCPMPERNDFFHVYMGYVLNVIPSPEERIEALQTAALKTIEKNRSFLTLVTRTHQEIDTEATKKGWDPWNDGFVTSKMTFQRGFSHDELEEMCTNVLGDRMASINRLKIKCRCTAVTVELTRNR